MILRDRNKRCWQQPFPSWLQQSPQTLMLLSVGRPCVLCFHLSVRTNRDLACGVAKQPTRCPAGFPVDHLPLDLCLDLWDGCIRTFSETIRSDPLTSRSSLLWAGQTPPSLSHTFHWKTKWYSMLPIASSFIFPPMLPLCTADRFERNCMVISVEGKDKWRFSPVTWETPDFTMAI